MKKIVLNKKALQIFAMAAVMGVTAVAHSAKSSKNVRMKGPTLFRYTNEAGVPVTSHILPPEIAQKGYEIITYEGDVIQKVAPALTDEEKQAMLDAIEQKKYDKSLMLRYGSLADLRKSQKRKMAEQEAKLSVLQSNLSNINLQIESEQSKAANFERQGMPIPDSVISSLEGLYGNLERTEDLIRIREKEIQEERDRFKTEMDRYKVLKGLK